MSKENIVKETCRELGITQKELAKDIGVSEDTVSKWSRGVIKTPKWAIRLLNLLILEKKFNTIKQIFSEEIAKK